MSAIPIFLHDTFHYLFHFAYDPPIATHYISSFYTKIFPADKYIHSNKKKKQQPILLSPTELSEGCHFGIDSHADMTCVGAHAKILEVFEGQICNVYPFNDSYSPMTGVRTVNAAFAYDSEDGQTYILHANQALDFRETMKNSLLCPNQARINGVVIDDIPKFLDPSNRSTFSIFFPDQHIRIPLASKFPIAYIPVRKPTQEELNSRRTQLMP